MDGALGRVADGTDPQADRAERRGSKAACSRSLVRIAAAEVAAFGCTDQAMNLASCLFRVSCFCTAATASLKSMCISRRTLPVLDC